MKRNIIIPNLNNGKEFELPQRKNKHRLSMLEEMLNLPEKLRDNKEYRDTMENIYMVYFVLKDIFPKLTIDDVKEIESDLTMEITRVLYGLTKEKFEELVKGNFPKTKIEKLTTEKK
jgi:hypothetical protein